MQWARGGLWARGARKRKAGTHLLEPNVDSVLTETSSAKHHVVFANQTVVVPALPAHVPKSALPVLLGVCIKCVRHCAGLACGYQRGGEWGRRWRVRGGEHLWAAAGAK